MFFVGRPFAEAKEAYAAIPSEECSSRLGGCGLLEPLVDHTVCRSTKEA